MNWYKGNVLWKEIIETVSRDLKRNPIMVEKDTIQSLFLYELSQADFPFVFKGGTSLSKVFDLIDRFSEDIDLSASRKLTDSEKRKSKKIIIAIAEELGLQLTNPEEVMSRHSYNKYVFKYSSFFSTELLEIIVETSYYQEVYPVVSHEVISFIEKYLESKNIHLPFSFPQAKFKMTVQSLERTLIDKIFAVCDYRIQNMMDRDSRHLYDIAKILSKIQIDDDLKELMVNVREDRMKSKNNPSANPKYNIKDILLEIIESRFYESDYKNITEKLLYEEFSYDRAIREGINLITKSNLLNYSLH